MKWLEVFLLPLGGMLVHRRSLPHNFVGFPQQIAGTHLYTWVKRGTVRIKCLAQDHNTMSPASAQTRTACSWVERTNHEATTPPMTLLLTWIFDSDSYSVTCENQPQLSPVLTGNASIYIKEAYVPVRMACVLMLVFMPMLLMFMLVSL